MKQDTTLIIKDVRTSILCMLSHQTIVGNFKNWFESKSNNTFNVNICVILLGDPNYNILLNHLLLIVKRYIYSCKHTKKTLNFIEVIYIIKYHILQRC